MPIINAAPTADRYPNATGANLPILARVYNSRGGWFSVSGASVFCELEYGPHGSEHWTDEVLLGAGAFAYLDTKCTGVRFRSAAAGVPATITAQVSQGDEPPLSIIALGQVGIVSHPPTQQILAASGVYTPPAGCTGIYVELWGDGGGGGGVSATAAGQYAAGGGGGGGAYVAEAFPLTALPGTIQVVIGGGGAAGVANGNGGGGSGSAFGSTGTSLTLIQAGGGAGGQGGAGVHTGVPGFLVQAFGGSGGVANAPSGLALSGQDGCAPTALTVGSIESGTGGIAPRSTGFGREQINSVGALTITPATGYTPGNGGGGAISVQGGASSIGAAGGKGLAVITEFYS